MTDLLSVEDIKKAVGAFAGEQRAPPHPSPLPSSTPPAPVHARRAGLPSAPLSAHPVGRRRGGEVGVLGISQTPSGRDLEPVGRQDALREQPKVAGAKGWVAVLRGLGSGTKG